ncbi:MAG: hypothetical protein Q9216_007256, partial [Gyalolechia sp. 2 TL-2023]
MAPRFRAKPSLDSGEGEGEGVIPTSSANNTTASNPHDETETFVHENNEEHDDNNRYNNTAPNPLRTLLKPLIILAAIVLYLFINIVWAMGLMHF